MDFLQAGVNLIYIRDLLGHSDVATTEIYARADTEMKRQALEAVHIPGMVPSPAQWAEDTELLQWIQLPCKPST